MDVAPRAGAAAKDATTASGDRDAGAAPMQLDQANAASTGAGARGAGNAPLSGSLQVFGAGVAKLQALLGTLVADAESERSSLAEGWARLDRDRQAFEQEKGQVAQVLAGGSSVVRLNVGGTHFTTSQSTLSNAPEPCLFNAMFSGRHTVQPGEDGAIFIDRDGSHFRDVLNFLRDGTLAYPPPSHFWQQGEGKAEPDWRYLLALRAEAEFYGLTKLVEEVDRYPYGVTPVQRGVLTRDASWLYEEDGPDEVVLSVDKPALLLGVGMAGSLDAGSTLVVELQVAEVEANDFSQQISELASVAQSFAETAQIAKLMLPAPVRLEPGRTYMLSATINAVETACCEDCLEVVVAQGIRVKFQPWESANGTSETRGNFPVLYVRPL